MKIRDAALTQAIAQIEGLKITKVTESGIYVKYGNCIYKFRFSGSDFYADKIEDIMATSLDEQGKQLFADIKDGIVKYFCSDD